MAQEDGLDALVAGAHGVAAASGAAAAAGNAALEVEIGALTPSRYQPRQHLPEASLHELADSIRAQGVLQPLIVRNIGPAAGGGAQRYEVVAGERRWRAAQLAGLATVPVLVRNLDDQSALAVALIENVQREDLNPIDQARSVAQLASEFRLTHEQVAQALGRSCAWVTNLLRLLDLNDEVKALLVHGKIDMGHARALLPLDARRQVRMARKADTMGLSVRQVEQAVRAALEALDAPAEGVAAKAGVDLQARWLQRQISQELGQSVAIRPGKDGDYTLQIGFGNLVQLQAALERIQELIGSIRETAGPRARDAQGAE